MRKLNLLLLMLIAPMVMLAQGMTFEPQGTLFKDAVAKAKQSGKRIFLDCYTSWCGPCKNMARNVFPSDSAGNYMNPRFVNLQIDMEKGEGPELAKKLQVNAYPTFIIFDSDGTELNRFLGSSTTTVFLEKVAASLTDKTVASLKSQYDNGNRDPKLVLDYLHALGKAQKSDDADKVAEELLKGKTETFLQDSTLRDVFILYVRNPFSESFRYAATHQKELDAVTGNRGLANMKISNVLRIYPLTLLTKNGDKATVDTVQFNKFVQLLNDINYDKRDAVRLSALIGYAEAQGDLTKYMKYVHEYLDTPGLDATDMELLRWAKPFATPDADPKAKADMIAVLEKRRDEIASGKRQPQTRIGNMLLSGKMQDTLSRVIEVMKTGKLPQQ